MAPDNTAPVLGIVTDDETHVRVLRSHWDHIADVMERQERHVRQLETRVATLTAANTALADELDKARAARDAYKAQLEGRTRELMAHHEEAVRALNATEGEG